MTFQHWVPFKTDVPDQSYVAFCEKRPSDGGYYTRFVDQRLLALQRLFRQSNIQAYVSSIIYPEQGGVLGREFSRLVIIIASSQLERARQILEPRPEQPIEDFIPQS